MKRHVLLPAIALFATAAWPHPMGNSSVSHYARIELTPNGAKIRYVLDLAPIPAAELRKTPQEQATNWGHGLKVEVAGRRVEPVLERATSASGPDGLRVEMDFRVDAAPGTLRYEDGNYRDRPGWKEIVVPGAGADRTNELKTYPPDAMAAPPQELEATVPWGSTEAAPPPQADYLARILHQRELSWGMLLTALAVAFGAGAVHALSPGHGKTIVAAYLVGTRGTPKHAIFLGGMVTFTHTISVFGLGLTTLFLSQYVLPEKIFPILGAISGISIVWIGTTLFFKRLRAATGKSKPHHHHHGDGLVHDHGDGHYHSHVPEGEVSMASLIALGASGGLVPCPSALVLLLSSVALGRVALGLTLLVAFSAGLAIVLMAIGLIVLYAKHLLPDREKTARSPVFRWVPVASAGIITVAGVLMTGAALVRV